MARSRAGLLGLALLLLASLASATFVIEDAKREIDISTQRAKVKATLKIKNEGRESASEFIQCNPGGLGPHLAYFKATQAGKALQSRPWDKSTAEMQCVITELSPPVGKGKTVTLQVDAVYTGVLVPVPAQLAQGEPQRVAFTHMAHVLAPYKVAKQTTKVVLQSAKVEDYTEVAPTTKKGKNIEYGPYTNTEPYTYQPFTVHYHNSFPFIHATQVVREIEISHWGNVYFEERYNIRHAGAKAKAAFSRYDFATQPSGSEHVVRSLAAALPAWSRSFYYRDDIGNISSSYVLHSEHQGVPYVGVALAPRYPLLGGWSTKFVFGWSEPLDRVVSATHDSRLVFNAAVAPALRDLVVDELVVKVVLPEGATDAQLTFPVEGAEQWAETRYTYLDVRGRTVLAARVANFVPEADGRLLVHYRYSSLALLQKPLVLSLVFGSLFALVILFGARGGEGQRGKGSAAQLAKQHAE